MLKDNKVSKYLLYAIGEIVLVMIGILLALQVNEWNNERNRNKAEAVILEQLKADLKKSQTELIEFNEMLETMAKASAIVCHAFYKKDTPNDSIYKYMTIPLGTAIYSPTMGTARSLINSGNIALLNSERLKNDITSYVEEVDYKLKDISRYEETYYRNGILLISDFGILKSKATIDSLIEETTSPTFKSSRDDELSFEPNVIEKVPFATDLQQLFQDRNVYKAYKYLVIAHRNRARKYTDILNSTNELLKKLETVSN